MTEINLLQNSAKKQIHATIRYVQIINSIFFLSIMFISVTIILFASKSYLNLKINQLNNITNIAAENQDIDRINSLVYQAENVQQDYVKWSRVFINFFSLIPAHNKIKDVSFDKNEKIMILNGHADTRKAFLKLKNNLENSDLIIKVDSPITNLLHQTDFDFSLSAQLNL